MQLYDQMVELSCIKTLTNPKVPEDFRLQLLGKLSKEFFHFPPCKQAFGRIDTLAKKRFVVVEYDALVTDPALSEDARDVIRESDVSSAKNKNKALQMIDTLDSYRKIRIVYDMCNEALDNIEGDEVEIDKLLNKISSKLVNAHRNVGVEDQFLQFGANNNSEQVVEGILNKTLEDMIKTGFTEYDKRNGGLPKEGVMLLGATTSGGKSTVLMNLLVNLYLRSNLSVHRISLEMGNEQETARLLSHISKVPFWKIKQNKMSPLDKKNIKEAYKKFVDHGTKNNCTFATMSPTRGMTIDDALRTVKAYGPKVVAIDYVSLLEGVDEDNQWRVLSAIVRSAKIFSREAKCLIIILVQIEGDSNKIRYSQGMKEHADVVWQWNYTKREQRELKIIPMEVTKVRDGELMTFNLGERFEIMTVENMADSSFTADEDDRVQDGEDDETPKKKKKKKDKKKKNNVHSLDDARKKKKKNTYDDDDDDDGERGHAYAVS